ncbi:hypothetical protein I2W78_35340 [Streptomyces spinoverrucosus]|uniref:hypothetical protein n=1 Tax=Streptomyces spinoverrucosus TaxID=284043 RepID=UPI0018C3E8B0|nr:hypothetical protein [Streptomyces spinoverrucosus]MBG0856986.1 hypothetical protein [Streptomyces spinoverrucosus]
MNIARCLDTIDRLCSRPFPAEHGRSDVGREGPGYYITELGAADPQCAHGERTAEDVEAFREGIAQLLDERWGAKPLWGMLTLRVRGERGEEIPEPWASISAQADDLYVWEATGTGRWVALGIAHGDEADPARLLAVVTEVDPE